MKLLTNLPDFLFPTGWLSILEAEELTNFDKIEYGSTEDYDPDTSDLVLLLDGRGFKDWAEIPDLS